MLLELPQFDVVGENHKDVLRLLCKYFEARRAPRVLLHGRRETNLQDQLRIDSLNLRKGCLLCGGGVDFAPYCLSVLAWGSCWREDGSGHLTAVFDALNSYQLKMGKPCQLSLHGLWCDVTLFRRLPRIPTNCHLVFEAKRLGAGVEGALNQAKDYVQSLGVPLDIVVTDGVRYRMYSAALDYAPVAYANLVRLKCSALDLFNRIKRP